MLGFHLIFFIVNLLFVHAAPTIDYVIIGAGPSGFVLAEQLSQDPKVHILLLEAGPPGTHSTNIDTPAYAAFNDPSIHVWNFSSQPDPRILDRSPPLAQGHAFGGGTAVNYMAYCRGAASTFDEWADISGDEELKWDSLLNDFKATSHLPSAATDYKVVTNHSVYGDGPLEVSVPAALNGFDPHYMQALKSTLNLPEVDLNDGIGIGAAYERNSIRVSNRTRDYALQAYGWQMAGRPNVQILHGAWANHIAFEGNRAKNVTFWSTADNSNKTISANEIIVSAGAINSPKLLMLSGVGPRAHLQELGIPVVHDVSGVGSKLYDHHFSVIEIEVIPAVETFWQWSYNTTFAVEAQTEYRKNGSGILGTNGGNSYAIFRVPDSVYEAVNDTFGPSLPSDRGQLLIDYVGAPFLHGGPNASIVTVFVALVQPQAYGHIRLNSTHFRDDPLIFSNYYGSAGDKAAIIYGYKKLRETLQSEATKPIVVREVFPGPDATTDEQLWHAIQKSAQTFHHPLGTVALGTVLNKDWRIKGLDGIRVVDSSAFPYPPTCHLQATAYAMAYRAARAIKKADGLA